MPGTQTPAGSTHAHRYDVLPNVMDVGAQIAPPGQVPPHCGYGDPMQGVTPSGRHWQPRLGNSSGQHRAPAPQEPLHAGAVLPQASAEVVEVVEDVVVVVDTATQPPALQASQQLATAPTQAFPPAGAVHDAALGLT